MNQKLTFVALAMYAAAYGVLLFMWFYFVTNHVTGAEDFVGYIKLTLAGLTGHVLTILPGGTSVVTTVESVKAAQSGFASPRLLALIAAVALIAGCVSGCTTAARAWEAGAQAEIKAGNDNVLAVWKAAGCAMPVGAILRDPDAIETVNRFCGGPKTQLGATNAAPAAAPASAAK